MRILRFFLGCFLAVNMVTAAQSLDVFNIDASRFPIMKAKFRAYDTRGNNLRSLVPADFTVSENTIVRRVTRVSCPEIAPLPNMSIAMSIDVSGSMRNGMFNDVPVELGKRTAVNILNAFSMPPNEFALQTCHAKALLHVDFTTNKKRLLEAIAPIKAWGDNDFVEHLLNPEAGLLNLAKKGKYKRVAIIYTDSRWYALTPEELQRCIDTCTKYEIRFFAALYSRPESEPNGIKKSLTALAEATGGRLFTGLTGVIPAEALGTQFPDILGETCEVEWESGPGCSTEQNVAVEIPELGLRHMLRYDSPAGSVATLLMQPGNIDFRFVTPGSFKDTTFVITARNSDIRIGNIVPSHPAFTIESYNGSSPPFTLMKNESRTVTIRFTPADSSRVIGAFEIKKDICTDSYQYFSGGHSRFTAQEEDPLRLMHPNGGEVLVVGSDSVITWEGVLPDDTVQLSYSFNNGDTWNIINERATGLKQDWHIPNTPSDQCLVRVEYSATPRDTSRKFEWAVNAFGDNALPYPYLSTARNIVDSKGNSYTCGYFTGSRTIGNTTLLSYGGRDMYIAKYDPEGTPLWVHHAGSATSDEATGLTLDAEGNVYVCGYFTGSAVFDNGFTLTSSGLEDIFIAKYDNSGTITWAKSFGSANSEKAAAMTIDRNDNVFFCGSHIGIDFGNGFRLLSRGGSDGFVAKITSEGGVTWAKSIGGGYEDKIRSIATDKKGMVYISGNGGGDFGSIIYFEDEWRLDLESSDIKSSGHGFLAKFNNQDGRCLWAKKSESDFIAIDSLSNLYTCGNFSYTIDLGNGVILDSDNPFGTNDFIARYDSDGKALWASMIKGAGNPLELTAIAATSAGSIYVCGKLEEYATLDFGNGVGLTSEGRNDIFLAHYTAGGTARWVEVMKGGSYVAAASSLAIDPLENAYLAGIYERNIRFGTVGLAGPGTFLAKYAPHSKPDQSDVSDRVFSIVSPAVISHDIDMGEVVLTFSKDSLLESFIINAGTYPVSITAITVTGQNSSDFQLVSGVPPFTIAAGEKKAVEFRFRPSAVGSRFADISIITQADTLHHNIVGEGVRPVLQVQSSLVDFGVKEVGSTNDTTVTAVLKNIGDSPLTVTSTQMLGPDKEQFAIISGGGSFFLTSGEERAMQLRFSPKYIGRTSGQIGFTYDNMADRPEVVQLFGQGIGGTVLIPDDSSYIGETRTIKLLLGTVHPTGIAQAAPTSFRARIAFSNTILTPAKEALSGTTLLTKSATTDTLDIARQWNGQTAELARIPMVACLGDGITTPIELLVFDWLDEKGDKIEYETQLQSGKFTVRGICTEGGVRLYDADGQASMFMVTPHPIRSGTELRFTILEQGITTISLTDVLGRHLILAQGAYPNGIHSVEISTNTLTNGIYLLMMQTPTQVFTQQVVIQK